MSGIGWNEGCSFAAELIEMKKYGLSFSWKRALGISGLRQRFARKTRVPTTKLGLERKIRGFSIDGNIKIV